MSKEKPKDAYHEEAVKCIGQGRSAAQQYGMDIADEKSLLVRGLYQLAITSLDDALSSFESVLVQKPTNIVALMGKVCERIVECFP